MTSLLRHQKKSIPVLLRAIRARLGSAGRSPFLLRRKPDLRRSEKRKRTHDGRRLWRLRDNGNERSRSGRGSAKPWPRRGQGARMDRENWVGKVRCCSRRSRDLWRVKIYITDTLFSWWARIESLTCSCCHTVLRVGVKYRESLVLISYYGSQHRHNTRSLLCCDWHITS